MDDQINLRREEFNELNDTNKNLKKMLEEATNSYTNDQLRNMIEKLKNENEEMSGKVSAFKSGGIELISEEQLETTYKEQKFYLNSWKKVKRGCREILDVVSEAADLNPKEFMKQLGMETDEEYNVAPEKMIAV